MKHLFYWTLFVVANCLNPTILSAQEPPCGPSSAPGNDVCNATLICDFNGYCGSTPAKSVSAWALLKSTISSSCTSGIDNLTLDNDRYLKFVAGSNSISLDVYVSNCQKPVTTKAIQMAVFSAASCNSGPVDVKWCDMKMMQQAAPHNVNVGGLTAGQTYYILIDGYSGQNCNFKIAASSGISTGVTADINQNSTLCAGQSVTVTAGGGSGTYTWSGDAGLGATTGTTVTITPPSTPGSYSYKISSSGSSGGGASCPTSDEYDFTINVQASGGATPTFNQIANQCAGTAFTLPSTSTNGIVGTWSPAVDVNNAKTYTFTPTAGGGCGSSPTTTMTVTVNPKDTPDFTNPGPLCNGISFTLPTTSTNGITGTWSPAVNNTATTTYTFTPDAGQCANTETMTVTITANQVTPTFTEVGSICSGMTFTLPTPSNEGVTGTWSPAINNTATTTYTFTPNASQCANTATMTVTVESQITPTFNAIDPICAGTDVTLPATSNNGTIGTWSPAFNNGATTTYTFTPTPGQGSCDYLPTTLTVTVKLLPTPMFTASPDNGGAPLDVTFTNQSTNANSYSWNYGNGQTAVTTNGTTIYTAEGSYNVTLTASNGICSNSYSITVTVIELPKIVITPPNVFTPNGDGVNDTYSIYTENAKEVHVELFNRWGNVMQKLNKPTDYWDGKNATDGVYFYKYKITDLKDEVHEGHGFFHLVR